MCFKRLLIKQITSWDSGNSVAIRVESPLFAEESVIIWKKILLISWFVHWDSNFYNCFIVLWEKKIISVNKAQYVYRCSRLTLLNPRKEQLRVRNCVIMSICIYVFWSMPTDGFGCNSLSILLLWCALYNFQAAGALLFDRLPKSRHRNFTKTKHSSLFADRRGFWLFNIRNNKRDMIIYL